MYACTIQTLSFKWVHRTESVFVLINVSENVGGMISSADIWHTLVNKFFSYVDIMKGFFCCNSCLCLTYLAACKPKRCVTINMVLSYLV